MIYYDFRRLFAERLHFADATLVQKVLLICGELDIKPEDILDFDLYLADATPSCTFGVHDEFLSSGRLDDLSMCFAGLEGMIPRTIPFSAAVLSSSSMQP